MYLYLYWDWELVEYASFLADFARYTSPLLRNSAVSNSPSLSWLYLVFVFVFCQLSWDILSGFPLTNANSFPSSLSNLLHSICLPTTGTAGRALTCIYVRLEAVVFVFVFVFFSLLLQVGKCRGVRHIPSGSAVGPKARQDGGALCLSLITLSERSLLQLLLSECEICSNGQAGVWKMSSTVSLLPFDPW